jgi:hypothetical protein
VSAYGYGLCAFCGRRIGTQSGRLRNHKFDDAIQLCPGSDLKPEAAEKFLEDTRRGIVTVKPGRLNRG